MIYSISNGKISAKINSLGAELTQLRAADGTDYICPTERLNWSGIAPVLFPNTGEVFLGRAVIEGREYPYTQHGFAKISEFKVTDKSDRMVRFVLHSSEKTLQVCPFEFELNITYRLIENRLIVDSEIRNNSDNQTMYCSLGFHPAFSCPIVVGEQAGDYCLEFPEKMTASRIMLADGLVNGVERDCWRSLKRIMIKEKMFDGGSFSMTDLSSKTVVLSSRNSGRYVRVDFADYPNLILWAPKYKPVTNICIEPWYGRPDRIGENDISSKPDNMMILPEESKCLSFSIEIG